MMIDWRTMERPILALSPMADMTDSAFCRVVREIDGRHDQHPLIVFREMVSAEAVARGNNKTLAMTEIHTDERPLIQQIFGSDPSVMGEAVRRIEAEHHPDGFDINMGCPVYKIVHAFNGAALMREPKLAGQIIKAMKSATALPVSVKIRTGWSDPTDCLTFAKVVEDAGADMITIHGRTKTQGYSGRSDWHRIAEVKQKVRIPVLANGDIHKPSLVPEALSITGADGVLIARGALGHPWFFSEARRALNGQPIAPITIEERHRIICRHFDLHIEQYGPRGAITFRKHLTWYFKGLPQAKHLRGQLVTLQTKKDLESLLGRLE